MKHLSKSERSITGNVKFKNVAFSYPSRKDVPVLKDISFEVNER